MDTDNPYQPPSAFGDGGEPRAPAPASGEVPAAILETMRQTRPWVLFLGVLGFVGCGLMVIAALGMAVTSGIAKWMGLAYLVLAVIYLFPSLSLCRYGAAIRRLLAAGGMEGLAVALRRQTAFWRLIGIITIAVLALYVVVIVAVVLGGGFLHRMT
jgi:hypothetical protein